MQVSGSQSQLYQLLSQRNKSVQEMVDSIQQGSISTAQAALSQIQQTNKSLGVDDNTDASTSGTTSVSAGLSPMKTDLTAMMQAVQSGDLTSAQTAWKQMQSDMASGSMPPPPPGPPPSSGTSTDSTSSDSDTATDDLSKLLDAVKSGDTDAMKTSATAFAKDLQNILGTSSTSSTASTSTSTDVSSTGNPILDDLNALVQAAQSGDTNAAQTAQQKLHSDMQATEQASGAGHAHGHHHHHGGGGKPEATSQSTSATTATTVLAADGTSPDSTTTTSTDVDMVPA